MRSWCLRSAHASSLRRARSPALEFLVAADALSVDEHLRHRLRSGNGAERFQADVVRQRNLHELDVALVEQSPRLRAVLTPVAREDRDLVRLASFRVDVREHRRGVRYLERIPGLVGLDEHLLDDAVAHEHRVAPRALAEAEIALVHELTHAGGEFA